MYRIRSLAGLAAGLPPAIYAATACGWLLSATLPSMQGDTALCGSSALADGLVAALTLNPPVWLASSWMTMLLAMMPLLVAGPLLHLRGRDREGRSRHAVAAFIAGYSATWLATGMILIPAALLLQAIAGQDATAFALVALAALFYQATPLKRWCLDRCHRRHALGIVGARAVADAVSCGITHGITYGIWCVGACWGLMLLPLVAGAWHLPVMAMATLVMLYERYRAPRPRHRPLSRMPLSSLRFRNCGLSPRTQR